MATSRTGTTKWLHLARRARLRAQAEGVTHCPLCSVELNYREGLTPASAEVDHITPASLGGADTLDNVRVICRLCNQRRGNGRRRKKQHSRGPRAHKVAPTASSATW